MTHHWNNFLHFLFLGPFHILYYAHFMIKLLGLLYIFHYYICFPFLSFIHLKYTNPSQSFPPHLIKTLIEWNIDILWVQYKHTYVLYNTFIFSLVCIQSISLTHTRCWSIYEGTNILYIYKKMYTWDFFQYVIYITLWV